MLQERSKKLRKSVYEIDENIKNTIDNLDAEIKYCQDLVKAIEKNDVIAAYPKVREKLNMLNETLIKDAGMYVCKEGHMAIRKAR